MGILHGHLNNRTATNDSDRSAEGDGVHPSPSLSPKAVTVWLSPGLAEMAPALTSILGGDFTVTTDHHSGAGVMLSGPVGPAGVAFLRACYPRYGLLIVDRRWGGRRSSEVVISLEAGADGYLTSPSTLEVASHVQALARRYTGYASSMTAA
jgi:hypothetical protein